MTESLTTLLLLSASGSVLGLVLMLARRLCGRRLPSTLWYYAWLPVLIRLVLPLPGLIPQAQPAEELPVVPAAAQTESAGPRSYHYNEYETVAVFGRSTGESADTTAAPAVPAAPGADITETPSEPILLQAKAVLQVPGLWLAVWLAGAALCFVRYTAGYIRFRRVLMRTLETTDGPTARVYRELTDSHNPRLFRSAYVKTPMLLGLVRPLIVLPHGGFSEGSTRNVLRHELTHYRRGDLYVKWFFVAVASLHWFNPLMLLFRRELDRVCELSCDETVLARMQPSERRSYGETLLDLAANRTLPAGVVATTFATEKRALKERLEQIMKFKYKPRAILALTIAALLLMGAAALAAAPARASAPSADSPEPAPAPNAAADASGEASLVSADVDAFLASIAPDATIALTPGLYDLSTASDYGQETDSEYYRWEEVHDGYELVIENVANLTIASTVNDASATVISAVPRYADVLAFRDCRNITLSGFTAGHTVEQGQCMGGVIHLMGTDDVTVSGCALYGCGVLGVEAENCRNLLVSASDIYECSNGAVWLTSCNSVQFDRCSFRDCYNHNGNMAPAFQIFKIDSCYGVAITDGHVYGNYAGEFVHVSYSQEVYLLGTLFEDNNAMREDYLPNSGTVLSVAGDPITVAGCEFRDSFPIYAVSETSPVVDMDGSALNNDDLAVMKQEAVAFPGFAETETPELERTQGEGGRYEVHVSTVDEFLAAIAPDTTIYLAEGLYDLSTASKYGAYGSQYYYWVSMFDGPELVISGVENLTIIGPDTDTTRIEALPRYAAVLRFNDCESLTLSGFTAGHTLAAGTCSGAVLELVGCEGVDVLGCGLFGCGIYGIEGSQSRDITVQDCEIYECSMGAVRLGRCADVVFANNDIHDCAYPTYRVGECLDVTIDGEAMEEEAYDGNEEYLGFAEYASQEADAGDPFMQAVTQSGTIIFNVDLDIPGAGPYSNPNIQG